VWRPRLYMCKGLYDEVVCPRLSVPAKALCTLSWYGLLCCACVIIVGLSADGFDAVVSAFVVLVRLRPWAASA
jgi:hypothetical protein